MENGIGSRDRTYQGDVRPMKELVVISGKGGTGKTSLVGSLSVLATNKVLADCDVDAANLHLLLKPNVVENRPFYGLKKAHINDSLCVKCNKCAEICHFDAIRNYTVDPMFCEGCGVCSYICPERAVEMIDRRAGFLYRSKTKFGPFVHAELGVAEENSGKLVAAVRNEARMIAEEEGYELLISDGPPGIGCPVISCLPDADLILVVTEPTLSGIHDMERVLDLVHHFGGRAAVCINKWDISEDNSAKIDKICKEREVELVGRIPYDNLVNTSLREGRPLVQYKSRAADAILGIWDRLLKLLA